MDGATAGNAGYIEHLYERYREAPDSVTPRWRAFFEGFELGLGRPGEGGAGGDQLLQHRADALIQRYRDLGHLLACLDPLTVCPTSHPLLDPDAFGLAPEDLGREVVADVGGEGRLPLGGVVDRLRETYCRSVGVELTHLQDPDERRWLLDRLEPGRSRPDLDPGARKRVFELLARSTRFEEFLQKRYPGQTRFSLEGAETLVPLLDAVLDAVAGLGAGEAVLGMAHRGRLTVQSVLLGRSLEALLCAFEASHDPDAVPGAGDVKYHDGFRGAVTGAGGRRVRVLLPENPSHLEAVNPVVAGIARALQDRTGPDGARRVVPVLVHGDAAFMGQGVVAETLNLSQLDGYRTGGTVHVVLNNQIGYTTLPENARSTRYATDVAKMLMVPIFHVHGEAPDSAVHVARLAAAYRAAFGKDVVIDLVCYRRHGHNEGDEPYFTQPEMYRRIRERPPVHRLYGDRLEADGVLDPAARDAVVARADADLRAAHDAARAAPCQWHLPETWDGWEGIGSAYDPEGADTGVPEDRLRDLGRRLWAAPEGFRLHPTLRRVLARRQAALEDDGRTDWAGAEALAFASLVTEGTGVRLSGEDARRGTFSQRHATWFDAETGEPFTALEHLAPDQAPFRAYDSPLSEFGVLGFEYGYATVDPRTLVLWEAQYGDFANGAQVVIDQFVATGEAKWRRRAGLVLLLPHGYEGAGPDHSTARLERFLQLCAEDNLLVVQPTTPAQYFHALRRQVRAPYRKPLVVMAPKSLLRHPELVSPTADLAAGRFRPVIGDPGADPSRVSTVLLCTGKVFYDLVAARGGREDVAVVRLEQLYPFPAGDLAAVAARYPAARWRWVQEEPRNMGAWAFAAPRLREVLGAEPAYVGRPASASPATGFGFIHREEQARLVAAALTGYGGEETTG